MRLTLSSYLLSTLPSITHALYSSSSPVQLIKDSSKFQELVINSDKPSMVEFFASWCGHCKNLAPQYEKAAESLKGIVNFVAVEDESIMSSYGVKGFPSLKFFEGKSGSPTDYSGPRNAKGLVDYSLKKLGEIASDRLGEKVGSSSGGGSGGSSGGGGGGQCGGSGGGSSGGSGSSSSSGGGKDTIILTDSNFDQIVMKDEKSVFFVKFYAPWCGHCKAIAGVWDDLATSLKGKVKVAKMDATVEKSVPSRFGVNGFPSIKLFPSGKKLDSSAVDYNGGRDLGSFEKFALEYYGMSREAEQLISQSQFDEQCSPDSTNICVIAFLPHLIESSAEDRLKKISDFNKAISSSSGVPCSYFWSQGGDQFEFEEKLNLGFGYPALVGISMKKKIFVVHRGTFDETGIRKFLLGLSAPKHLNDLPKTGLPKLVTQKSWDGKDMPKEEEEL